MERLGRQQPELLSFILVFTEELSSDAHELAVYLFFTIYTMFEKKHRKIRKIKPREIERTYEQNEQKLKKLQGAHDKFLERQASVFQANEPFVMKYLVEALLEREDPGLTISEDEEGALFLYLKTAIDLLHGVTSGAG